MKGARLYRLALLATLALAAHTALAAEPFATASVRFEQNVTDGDFEVVFEAKGGSEGLAELTIVSPAGRKVIVVGAPEAASLGMRKFIFESPEPKDAASVKAAYPEGEYLFEARTFSGTAFAGKAKLSHRLPASAELVSPSPDAPDLAAGKRIAWRAVPGAFAYLVELKTETAKLAARVPGSSTSFPVPDGFMAGSKKYKIGIGAVGPDGNITFVEASFSLAP